MLFLVLIHTYQLISEKNKNTILSKNMSLHMRSNSVQFNDTLKYIISLVSFNYIYTLLIIDPVTYYRWLRI